MGDFKLTQKNFKISASQSFVLLKFINYYSSSQEQDM
jgi:hypothetical protein